MAVTHVGYATKTTQHKHKTHQNYATSTLKFTQTCKQFGNHKRTMKHLLNLLVIFVSVNAYGYYSPKMRNNFGANHAIFRLNAGYFATTSTQNQAVPDAAPINHSSMLDKMRMSAEAMIMVNNRGGFSEVSMHRPVFLQGKAEFDGISRTTLVSAGYAHGLQCRANFLFFGQVKGYFSAGAATMLNNDVYAPSSDKKPQYGARVGYNVYNRSSALQFETYAFKSKVLVTAMAYKKLGESILFQIGVAHNQPKLGFSALVGSCRISATTQYAKNSLQSGVNMTVNF